MKMLDCHIFWFITYFSKPHILSNSFTFFTVTFSTYRKKRHKLQYPFLFCKLFVNITVGWEPPVQTTDPSTFVLSFDFRTLAGMVALKIRTVGSKNLGIITILICFHQSKLPNTHYGYFQLFWWTAAFSSCSNNILPYLLSILIPLPTLFASV